MTLTPTTAQALIDTLRALPPCKTLTDTDKRATQIDNLRQVATP